MTTLHRRLRKWFEKAILDYGMLQAGDRVLVAVSGGADSLSLLSLFCGPTIEVAEDISLTAVHLDLGFEKDNDEDLKRLRQFFEKLSCECLIEKTDIGIHAHSEHNRKNPCFLCARLRRKRIYELAQQTGCNTIAMGHHKDDIVETFLLNVFFSREISAMVPNQPVFSGKFKIIRPLAYIDEHLIKSFARESGLPVLNNACPTSGTSYRTMVKELLAELEQKHKGVRNNIFKALSNVKLEYLLT